MGGGDIAPADLKDLLTPSLFTLLVDARLPYRKTEPIDWAQFGRGVFKNENDFEATVKTQAWPALIALSKMGLDNVPDLTQYLPPPTDPSYPEQCLGLMFLLDHCPRLLFSGVDHRYTFGYFQLISLRLAHSWLALPNEQRPIAWARWKDSVSMDYWLTVRFWIVTPFVHSQVLANQEIALVLAEETRTAVEKASGQTDPYRAQREAILSDLHGFPRVYRAGPPEDKDTTREKWMFWMLMLMDIHKPIIDHFGRYPYLNAILGRPSTEEEKKWIEEVDHFAEASKEEASKIKEDVEKGVWRPLGEDSNPPSGK